MGNPKGTLEAVRVIARLLEEHHERVMKAGRKSAKKSTKNSVGYSKLGGRKDQYELLQNMYISILKIQNLSKGPKGNSSDGVKCNSIVRVVRKGFQASEFYDGTGQRQRIHKYSAILRLAWMKRIEKRNLVRDIFISGGIEKFAAEWSRFNYEPLEDE